MTGMISIDKQPLIFFLIKTVRVLMLALLLAITASSQTRTESGNTPLGMQQGSPSGSYALSGFESVNPYSGGLNFTLPLLQVGGRGSTDFTVVLKRETKWAVIKTGIAGPLTEITYIPTPNSWIPDDPGYGPGKMVGRVTGVPVFNGACPEDLDALTRLTFIQPDGTEFEFRDATFEGQMKTNTFSFFEPNTCQNDFNTNRNRVFVTRDGSSATFISDADIRDYYPGDGQALVANLSGYMFLIDGACYRIKNGLVEWIRDRNGNKITFQYASNNRVTSITDSLNRSVTFTYSTNLDTITYKGFGGVPRIIKVHKALLEAALRPDYTLQTMRALFPNLNGASTEDVNNPIVVDYVELPDLRRYSFHYNSYGELARVELPTGGGFEYDWEAGQLDGLVGGTINGALGNKQIYRRVTQRRVYKSFGGTPIMEGKMTYSRPESSGGSNLGYVIVDHKSPGDQLLSREKHYFDGRGASPTFFDPPTGYPSWKDGREYKTEMIDSDGTTVLQKSETIWEQMPLVGWWGTDSNISSAPSINTRVKETRTSWIRPNLSDQVNKQEFFYDQYNNKTEVKEYDFGTGAPGLLRRRSTTAYLVSNPINGVNYTAYSLSSPWNSAHIRQLPLQQSLYDGMTNQEMARTTFEYDNYTLGLTNRSNITGHASRNQSPDVSTHSNSYVTRGNLTQVTKWVLQSNTPLSSRMQYDIAGNVVSSTDAMPVPRTTFFSFDDRYGTPNGEAQGNIPPFEVGSNQMTYAFATKVTNALNQSAYTQFDYNLGKPVNGEDVNGVVTSGRYGGYEDGTYTDLLDRATEIEVAANYPTNSGIRQRIRFFYDDISRVTRTSSDHTVFNDPSPLKSEILYDGLGRTFESRQYINEPGASYVRSLTEYDAMGRAFRTSNPLKSNETSVAYTTKAFDGLGRVKSVSAPDGSVVTTNYNGNQTTVIDPALKQRRSTTDGLGRLTRVEEMQPFPSTSVYAATIYTYDVLDNLLQVNQGSQTPRTFVFDSLKRLMSATNPESGQVIYTYDENSNLRTKSDARGITTTYFYDELDRVTSRTYNDNLTPTVNFTYENAAIANSTGKLTRVSNAVSSYDYLQFDALGRVKQSRQTTFADGANRLYQMSYSYNLAGEMTSQTYPSGKVIETDYDTAGRMSGIRSQGNYYVGAAPGDNLNRIQYTAHGAISSMRVGNSNWEHTNFNNLLQPTQIGLGTSPTDSSVLRLDYTYGLNTNNGNILTQQIQAPGLDVKQSYTYDQCNRLLTSTETPTASPQIVTWKQTFIYDPFGNRNFDVANTTGNVLGPNPTISPSSNRITTAGYSYDAAGNLDQEPGNKRYIYGGDSHQVSFTANSGLPDPATTQYIYDGDGRRVKRVDPNNTSVVFVYNAMGELIAEYATNTPTGAMQTSYLTTDHLGSTRLVTGAQGVVQKRYDFLPFGEELMVSRNGVAGYGGADTTRQKFTGHERDQESGLDYLIARYYSSAQGRFTSIDPLLASAEKPDPQTWNRFCYVTNNPMMYHDPTGERRNPTTNRRGINPIPKNGERGRIRANSGNPHVGEFGMVRNGGAKPHQGNDINIKLNTGLVAPESGVVVARRVGQGYGNLLDVKTANGDTYRMAHLSGYADDIKVGTKVTEGSVIAYSGNTGNGGGLTATNEDHLHFEVRNSNGQRINPVDWLNDPKANVPLEIVNPSLIGSNVTLNTSVSPDSPQTQQVRDWNYATGQPITYKASQQPLQNPAAMKHNHPPPIR